MKYKLNKTYMNAKFGKNKKLQAELVGLTEVTL